MSALTNKQKQAALRKRRADLGLKEIRGIWGAAAQEIEIKKKIKAIIKDMTNTLN